MTFSPTNISNLILWLDAADTSTISFSSGTNVSQWSDKSSIQNNMTQPTTGSQPIFGPMANGLNSLNFGGTKFLQNALMNFPNAPYTVFAIGYGTGTAYGRVINSIDPYLILLGSGSNGSSYSSFVGNGTNWNEMYSNSPNYVCTNLCMMEFTNNGTAGGLIPYFNGNVQTARNGATTSFTGLAIGKGYNATDQYWNGYICEVIIYSSVLTTIQRQQVEGYLAWKWDLRASLPTNHPYYKTILLNSTFSPANIGNDNLILWLDAADTTTISYSSGSNVSQWSDKSSIQNNMTQSTVSSQPIIGAMTNGLNSLNFDTNKWLQNVLMNFPNAPYTVFAIGYTNATSLRRLLNGVNDYNLFLGSNNSSYWTFVGDGTTWSNGIDANLPNYNCNNLCMIEFTNNGTAGGLIPYFNGNVQTAKNGMTAAFTGLTIGRGNSATNQSWSGYISEVIIYNFILTNTQRQQVEGYLAWKWGVRANLPSIHPYYRTLLPNSTFIPTNIANLVLWLDATDSSTIITSNGVNVTSWNDKSGQNNNFTTASGTPKITTKTINTLNAMDLTSSCFFKRDTFPLVSNYTIFIVGYTNTTSGESYMLGGYSNCVMFFGGVNGNFNTSNGDGVGNSNWNTLSANTPNKAITSTTGYVLSMVSDYTYNNGIFPYHNGTAQDKKNITYIPKVTSGLYIGATIAGAVYSNSVIGEILYYNGVLTTTQRQQVEGYLAWKWGLSTSLPTSHPYYSTPLLLSSGPAKTKTNIVASPIINTFYGNAILNIGATTNNTETSIVYTSGNTFVATVDQTGNVTVGNIGNTTISMVQVDTASYIGTTANTIVNVSKGITNITANASINKAYKSASFNIGATTNNRETSIVYTSGNTFIATVDQTGNVTVGNVGNATISMVQANTTNYIGTTANTIVNVSKIVPTITANVSFNVGYKSASFNIGATSNNTETTIAYASGNTFIATVDQTGNVTVGNVGNTTISMTQTNTANYLGITANTIVNVSKIVPTITANASYNTAYKSASFNIGATSNNTETSITYTSGNTYIATVDQTGNVIAGNAGSTTISMVQSNTANYLGITANTLVNVVQIHPNISVISSLIKTMGDSSFNLGATSTNTDTSIIQYISTNPDVANVVAGVVTIGNSGITTITSYQPETTNYFAVSANTTINVASLSYQPRYAFDNKVIPASTTEWRSAISTYNETTGVYTGSQSTTYNTSLSASGEWLQVKIDSAIVAKYYHLSWFIDSSTNSYTIPKSWILLGSADTTSWTLIDSFDYQLDVAPTNTSAEPELIQLRNIYTNNLNVQWYRLIVTSIFPGGSLSYTRISEMDFFAENTNTKILNRWIKPIVTRTHVLHPITILPFSTRMGDQTIYMLTDLDCNLIENNTINNGYNNTNIIKGAGKRIITSTCFDGQNLMATPMTGNICYINNDGMNTNLNFDISLNGSLFQKNITGNIYTSCFNGQRIIMGGTGTNVISYISPLQNSPDATFKPALNANHLMTSVFGLASNSGYGHVYIPNRIYMNPGEKLSVVAPKSYNQHLSETNTISMNLNNATITKNINI